MPDSGKLNTHCLRRLRAVRGFIFDLDGTLVLGDRQNKGLQPLPGAIEITRWLDQQAIPYVVFTNGTTRTPASYAQTLREMGFALVDQQLLTPAVSAAELFVRRGYRRVMYLGGEGLADVLSGRGIEPVTPQQGGAVDAVLVGWCPDFTMAMLEAACSAVWEHGAALYSASNVVFFASASGRALGTSRAITAMIRNLTGCRIQLVGKPSQPAFSCARHLLKVPARDIAVVGDDPQLEMVMAHRGGGYAVAVASGLANSVSVNSLPPSQQPDLWLPGVDALLNQLQQAYSQCS